MQLKIERNRDGFDLCRPDGEPIVTVYTGHYAMADDEALRMACLITAAPDLLAACEQTVYACTNCAHLEDKSRCYVCGRARAAIAAARGDE